MDELLGMFPCGTADIPISQCVGADCDNCDMEEIENAGNFM